MDLAEVGETIWEAIAVVQARADGGLGLTHGGSGGDGEKCMVVGESLGSGKGWDEGNKGEKPQAES